MVKPREHIIKKAEIAYAQHPRIIMFMCILLFYSFIVIQSYAALPRAFLTVFFDTWELLLFVIPLAFIILRLKVKNLFFFSAFYFILGFSVAFLRFPNFIKPEYATISFLVAIWFIGEWCNYEKFKKSLLSELLRGNYYVAFGLFLSTVVLGSIIELLNAPVGLWWYHWPFPSIELFGIPVFLAAFGWCPWILAMFVFFYPFALKTPKKHR